MSDIDKFVQFNSMQYFCIRYQNDSIMIIFIKLVITIFNNIYKLDY